jgi:hypothetical protein
MKILQEVDWIIWSSFHVDHLDYIAMDIELKIKTVLNLNLI